MWSIRPGRLSQDDLAPLESKLTAFEARKGSQIAVLIVPTTQPEAIEQYSIRVVDQWKVGRKKVDDGALLLVAKNDRALRIEVGYGLEGPLTDAIAKRIIEDVITPQFRRGNFYGGIDAGVDAMIKVIDGEALPPPAPAAPRHVEPDSALYQFLNPLNPFTIIFILLLGGVFRRLFGRLFGSLASGGLIGVLVWFVFGSLIVSALAGIVASVFTMFSDAITAPSPAGHGRGGSWSGGGSSWSGGGSSSSDSGGFSGGGGSFGGGGASGSW